MPSLSEIRTAVLANLDRVNAPTNEQANVTRWINQSIREDICAVHYWASMYARKTVYLTADVSTYSWPEPTLWKYTAFLGVREDGTGAFAKLDEVTPAELLYGERRDSTGIPRFWCKRGAGFQVAPTPDVSTYQIEVIGWKYPADLVDDGNTNDFTSYYSRLIEHLVTARGWLHYGEDVKADLWGKRADAALRQAISVDRERMLPHQATLVPGAGAGIQLSPRRRGERLASRPYAWV